MRLAHVRFGGRELNSGVGPPICLGKISGPLLESKSPSVTGADDSNFS
jgi:hypothetical protein